jgi:hypothetical protein
LAQKHFICNEFFPSPLHTQNFNITCHISLADFKHFSKIKTVFSLSFIFAVSTQFIQAPRNCIQYTVSM